MRRHSKKSKNKKGGKSNIEAVVNAAANEIHIQSDANETRMSICIADCRLGQSNVRVPMAACGFCDRWFHCKCLGLPESKIDYYMCRDCISELRETRRLSTMEREKEERLSVLEDMIAAHEVELLAVSQRLTRLETVGGVVSASRTSQFASGVSQSGSNYASLMRENAELRRREMERLELNKRKEYDTVAKIQRQILSGGLLDETDEYSSVEFVHSVTGRKRKSVDECKSTPVDTKNKHATGTGSKRSRMEVASLIIPESETRASQRRRNNGLPETFKCPKCDAEYPNFSSLARHQKIKHIQARPSRSPLPVTSGKRQPKFKKGNVGSRDQLKRNRMPSLKRLEAMHVSPPLKTAPAPAAAARRREQSKESPAAPASLKVKKQREKPKPNPPAPASQKEKRSSLPKSGKPNDSAPASVKNKMNKTSQRGRSKGNLGRTLEEKQNGIDYTSNFKEEVDSDKSDWETVPADKSVCTKIKNTKVVIRLHDIGTSISKTSRNTVRSFDVETVGLSDIEAAITPNEIRLTTGVPTSSTEAPDVVEERGESVESVEQIDDDSGAGDTTAPRSETRMFYSESSLDGTNEPVIDPAKAFAALVDTQTEPPVQVDDEDDVRQVSGKIEEKILSNETADSEASETGERKTSDEHAGMETSEGEEKMPLNEPAANSKTNEKIHSNESAGPETREEIESPVEDSDDEPRGEIDLDHNQQSDFEVEAEPEPE